MNVLLKEERNRRKYEEDTWEKDKYDEIERDDDSETDEGYGSLSRVN